MSLINVTNLSFAYEGSYDKIFDNVSFQIDTDWKLGFVGRNGRGKTTFMKLLMGEYEYSGKIISSVKFNYFPFEVKDKSKNSYEIAEEIVPNYEQWIFDMELNLLEVSDDCRWRAFNTLSGGEQTKILLAALFLRDNNFLLIDEPTNHLDTKARQIISKYLNNKKGFILISHDRDFLDGCVNHILSINKTNIEVQRGNFTSWFTNKERQDNFELAQNEKLVNEIDRLKQAAKQKSNWSIAAEDKKKGAADKGFMGAKAARQMKTSKIIEKRRDKTLEDKTKLLRNIETSEELKIIPQKHHSDYLITAINLAAYYGDKKVFDNLSFIIKDGERISIVGKNGTGKSTLLKLLAGEDIKYTGMLTLASNLKISYVSQDTSFLKGSPKEFATINGIDETLFMSTLFKLDFARVQFEKDMKDFSAGQKKKVLIAKSLCEEAHLYIWDEPLNYIDILSRMQIENLILEYKPTLIFVEHDKAFSETILTEIIEM